MLASALSVLKWTPETFWRSTVYEFGLAVKGQQRLQGGKAVEPLTREEYLDLMAEANRDEEQRKKASAGGANP